MIVFRDFEVWVCETGGSLKRPGPANAALASFCTARLSIVAKVLSMSCVVRQALLTPPGPNAREVAAPVCRTGYRHEASERKPPGSGIITAT